MGLKGLINNPSMSPHVNLKSAKLILSWCIEKYGPSEYANLKTLKIKLDSNLEYIGQYMQYNNTITLNPRCSTVIHEYTHFQQDMNKYHEYRTSYENHPYEISSNNRSNRDKLEAKRFILGKLRAKK
jgi:hypothetical protein